MGEWYWEDEENCVTWLFDEDAEETIWLID